MPSSEGSSGTRLAWRAPGAWDSVLMRPRVASAGPVGHATFRAPVPRRRATPAPVGSPGRYPLLLLRPVRAAEHAAQPLVQRVADLVKRADPVDGGAVGRRQPARLGVIEAAPDIADRDQLDPVGVDEAQAPVGGDHDPVEQVQPGYFEHVFERTDLLAGPGQHR